MTGRFKIKLNVEQIAGLIKTHYDLSDFSLEHIYYSDGDIFKDYIEFSFIKCTSEKESEDVLL